MASFLTGMRAAEPEYIRIDDDRIVAMMHVDTLAAHLQARAAHRVLPLKDNLLSGVSQDWTDGVNLYSTYYDRGKHEVELFRRTKFLENINDGNGEVFSVKNGVVTVKGQPGVKVTVEQLGAHVMLVERNARGEVVNAFYHITRDQVNDHTWTWPMQFMLAGHYTMDEKSLVFGPTLPHYTCDSYTRDPGLFVYGIMPDGNSVNIVYGNGRISHGDRSHPNWGKMPGGGGAAAIMGPMIWNVRFGVEGLAAIAVRDEPFVSHYPALAGGTKDETVLTRVQGPYEGLDGKWTVASVIPLTPALLRMFPKQALTLMRGEIYARHGDTFADPDTQRYFDAQPWYHRSGRPVTLTPVERFNYALIKQVEAAM